ncbi:uncharacterized protein EAF01_002959 [Botrytis porri]|uniref:uncharacterized protein n=1 Tax=Botrytis porri TaxID=87229 RepID=UPI0019004564|nr:uncharacterized protein EAF01_002959 [Botrytis porri]KAF7911452.1 hypothetical protein EAF01_002959 [Botrytis porri]
MNTASSSKITSARAMDQRWYFYQEQYPVTRLWLANRQFTMKPNTLVSLAGVATLLYSKITPSQQDLPVMYLCSRRALFRTSALGRSILPEKSLEIPRASLPGWGLSLFVNIGLPEGPIKQLIKACRLALGATFEYRLNENMNHVFLRKCALDTSFRIKNYQLSGKEKELCSTKDWR